MTHREWCIHCAQRPATTTIHGLPACNQCGLRPRPSEFIGTMERRDGLVIEPMRDPIFGGPASHCIDPRRAARLEDIEHPTMRQVDEALVRQAIRASMEDMAKQLREDAKDQEDPDA